MAISATIYNALFKRTSTFALFVITSAFVFDGLMDKGSRYVFETVNKGKLWNDIKDKYPPK